MKFEYERPEMEIRRFDVRDIITDSTSFDPIDDKAEILSQTRNFFDIFNLD